jgi:hypothetical protein
MPEACPTLERACARLEGRGRPRNAALMLRDASQRASAVEASALATCCDAPQHEGAARFGRTKPTVVWPNDAAWKDQPAAVGNNRRLRSVVSGLLLTMENATQASEP